MSEAKTKGAAFLSINCVVYVYTVNRCMGGAGLLADKGWAWLGVGTELADGAGGRGRVALEDTWL